MVTIPPLYSPTSVNLKKDLRKIIIMRMIMKLKKNGKVDKHNLTTVYGSRQSSLPDEDISRRRPFGLDAAHYTIINQGDDTQPVLLGQVVFNGEVLNRYSSPTYGIYLGTQPIPEPASTRPSTTRPPPTTMTTPIITTLQPPRIPQQIMFIPSMMPASTKILDYSIIIIPILLAVIKFALTKFNVTSFLKLLFIFLFKFKLLFKVLLLTLKFLLLFNSVSILPIFIILLLSMIHH